MVQLSRKYLQGHSKLLQFYLMWLHPHSSQCQSQWVELHPKCCTSFECSQSLVLHVS